MEFISIYLGIKGGELGIITFLPSKKGSNSIIGTLVKYKGYYSLNKNSREEDKGIDSEELSK